MTPVSDDTPFNLATGAPFEYVEIGMPVCKNNDDKIPRALCTLVYVPSAMSPRVICFVGVSIATFGTSPVSASHVAGGLAIPLDERMLLFENSTRGSTTNGTP